MSVAGVEGRIQPLKLKRLQMTRRLSSIFCGKFWSLCLGKRELVFVLIVHLFVSYAHVNLCHFFSSSWCRGLAAASACGSSWTFLFTFLHYSRGLIHNKFDSNAILTSVFKTIKDPLEIGNINLNVSRLKSVQGSLHFHQFCQFLS